MKKNKKESLFVKILNRTLKLPYLKLLELSIGFVKGFAIKINKSPNQLKKLYIISLLYFRRIQPSQQILSRTQ